MRISSRWARARTVAVAGAAVASGLLVAVGAAAPAGASAASIAPRVAAKYACSATVAGTKESWSGTITILGSVPKTAAPGGAVSLSGWQADVTIPKNIVDEAAKYASSIGGKLATFTINASDSKVKGVNAAGKGITVPTTSITTSSPAITLKLPAKAINVKGWTASSKGTMTFTSGNAVLDLSAATIIGPVSVTATCIATPATIGKVTVS